MHSSGTTRSGNTDSGDANSGNANSGNSCSYSNSSHTEFRSSTLSGGQVFNYYYRAEHEPQGDEERFLAVLADASDTGNIAEAHPETCKWIFEEPGFREWATTGLAVPPFWIRGSPGCGKSVMSSFLVSKLPSWIQSITAGEKSAAGKTIVAGCFCDGKNAEQRTLTWILKSHLYQIMKQNRGLMKHALTQSSPDDEKPDPKEIAKSLAALKRTLQGIANDPTVDQIYLVVDGLDRCGSSASEFLRLIDTTIGPLEGSKLRCIVTSRSGNLKHKKYGINLAEKNRHDMDVVMRERMEALKRHHGFDDGLRDKIEGLLKERSEGMFMWLSMVLDYLWDCEGAWSEDLIRKKIQDIPPSVHAIYKDILTRIESSPSSMATQLRTLLIWAFFGGRPLTVTEASAVLTVDIAGAASKRSTLAEKLTGEIEAMARGDWGALLSLRPEPDNTLRLSHPAVRDFLSTLFSENDQRSKYTITTTDAHRQIASTCLTYLRLSDITKDQIPEPPAEHGRIDEARHREVKAGLLQKFPLLDYSVEFLGMHLRESQTGDSVVDVPGTKEFFAADSAVLQCWVRAYDLLKRYTYGKYKASSSTDDVDLLSASIRLNVTWLVQQHMNWFNSTELVSGIASGLTSTIAALSSRVNLPDPTTGWSAIHVAADTEAEDILEWLLKNGADANTRTLNQTGVTALHIAAAKGSSVGPRMVKLLLDKKANTEVASRVGGNTPLHYAIDGGLVETVQHLLNYNARVDAINSSGETPLHRAAARQKYDNIVGVLLEGGADPNAKTTGGTMAKLREAGNVKTSSIGSFAAAYDTSRKIISSRAQTALHIAAMARGTKTTIEVLLGHNANLNETDAEGRMVLHAAVVGEEYEAYTTLLTNKPRLDANAKDKKGNTPLSLFTQRLCEDGSGRSSNKIKRDSAERTLDALLNIGAHPGIKDNNRKSSIDYAEQAGLGWAVEKLKYKDTSIAGPVTKPAKAPVSPTHKDAVLGKVRKMRLF